MELNLLLLLLRMKKALVGKSLQGVFAAEFLKPESRQNVLSKTYAVSSYSEHDILYVR